MGSWFAGMFMLLVYLLAFLFIVFVAYWVIRRAVKDGILEARATVKNLEDPLGPNAE